MVNFRAKSQKAYLTLPNVITELLATIWKRCAHVIVAFEKWKLHSEQSLVFLYIVKLEHLPWIVGTIKTIFIKKYGLTIVCVKQYFWELEDVWDFRFIFDSILKSSGDLVKLPLKYTIFVKMYTRYRHFVWPNRIIFDLKFCFQ